VRRPAVHVSEQFSKRDVVFEIENVAKGVGFCRVVVEHQKDAGEGQHNKEVERYSAHAPRKRIANGVAIDLRGVQVQEDVR
jgi:hypothetical protein